LTIGAPRRRISNILQQVLKIIGSQFSKKFSKLWQPEPEKPFRSARKYEFCERAPTKKAGARSPKKWERASSCAVPPSLRVNAAAATRFAIFLFLSVTFFTHFKRL
jgi:hypothetical protein